MNFISYNQFLEDIKDFIEKIPPFDFVSYIPRSGIIPAFMYSKRYNVPFIDLNDVKNDGNTLIFDDTVNYGRQLNKIQKSLTEPKYAVIYYSGENGLDYKLDYKYKLVLQPRIFEWNWINQKEVINHSCFDIDGVLCEFPRDKLNSGEIRYRDYLKTAKPKYIPKHTIGCLCTARIEEDRKDTEEWLKKNNVKYNKLAMLKCTKEERIKFGLHTVEKIKEYSNPGYYLFVEDEPEQAKLISRATKKPVLCITDWKIY